MNKDYFKGVFTGGVAALLIALVIKLKFALPVMLLLILAAILMIILVGSIKDKGAAALGLKEDVRRVSIQGRGGIRQLNEYIYRIKDPEIKKELRAIGEACNRIVIEIGRKPEKAFKTGSFFEYYLPVTTKLISRYDEMEKLNVQTQDTVESMSNIKKSLTDLETAFKGHYDSMQDTDIIDTAAEIKVLESVMKNDGFKGHDIANESINENNK